MPPPPRRRWPRPAPARGTTRSASKSRRWARFRERGKITANMVVVVERRSSLGVGHCGRQLCHLPQPHHGPLHRVPGQPGVCHERGVHGCLGYLQCESGTTGHIERANKHSTHSTSTASRVGSRRGKCARSTIAIGSSRSTVDERPAYASEYTSGFTFMSARHTGAFGI